MGLLARQSLSTSTENRRIVLAVASHRPPFPLPFPLAITEFRRIFLQCAGKRHLRLLSDGQVVS